MASKNSMAYLQRQGIFAAPLRHTSKYPYHASPVLFRPIVFAPEQLGPDTPARRVVTQTEQERVPYVPVGDSVNPCGGPCPTAS